jgi:RNA polymerase sigma factor (sigma-70 family)
MRLSLVRSTMATTQRPPVLRFIRDMSSKHSAEQACDRELLRRFVEERDEGAFTAMFRRHSAMVLGVGLRIVRQRQDAEDVCQATFLLLAKKAKAMVRHESIAGWLHRTAYYLAMKARQARQRRTRREGQARCQTPPDPLAELSVRDLQMMLDDELNRLADKYRTPIILCCLEGKARDEAARLLGLPLSTVSGRLEAGREILRRRLAGRGVTLSLAFAGGTLLSAAGGEACAALTNATSKAALQVIAGTNLGTIVSIQVASLIKGGMKAMFLSNVKMVTTCGLTLAAAFGSVWALLAAAAAEESAVQAPPPAISRQQQAAPKTPQRAGPGMILVARRDVILALTPEGKESSVLTAPKGARLSRWPYGPSAPVRLSPDGSQAAYIVVNSLETRPPRRVDEVPDPWPFQVVVRKLGADEPPAIVDLPGHQLTFTWTPGGKRLALTRETTPNTFETVLLTPGSDKMEPLKLPAGVRVLDCSRDGKTFLVLRRQDKKLQLGLAATGDEEVRVLTDLHGHSTARLSPDRTKVLYTDADPEDKDAYAVGMSGKPYIFDIATGKVQPVAEFPTNAQAMGVAWAPDGKHIAYTWKQLDADLLKKLKDNSWRDEDLHVETEAFVIMAEPSGRNPKTVASAKSKDINPALESVDWR